MSKATNLWEYNSLNDSVDNPRTLATKKDFLRVHMDSTFSMLSAIDSSKNQDRYKESIRQWPHSQQFPFDWFCNNNRNPKRRAWQTVDQTLGIFDFREYGYDSLDDFFSDYYLDFAFNYCTGVWNSRHGWHANPYLDPFVWSPSKFNYETEDININSSSDIGKVPFHDPDTRTWDSSNWQFKFGSMNNTDGHKEMTAASFYGLWKDGKIELHAMIGTWFNWADLSSIDHAAYIFMKPYSCYARLK